MPLQVVLAARGEDKLKGVQKNIRELGGEAIYVTADSSKVQAADGGAREEAV